MDQVFKYIKHEILNKYYFIIMKFIKYAHGTTIALTHYIYQYKNK